MRRIGVLVHPTRAVEDAVDVLRDWAKSHDVEVVQIVIGDQPSVAPPGEVSACDLVAALGGDGTVLKSLHAAAKTATPVLGVAYGSLGALTAVPAHDLRPALDRFAAGDWFRMELPALELRAGDGLLASAINDCVLARRGGNQLILDLYVDQELYVRLAGDGVIVATALGSSAYSMAAGGSVLSAGTDVFICTPVAMHGGCAPPVVVHGDRELTVATHSTYGGFHLEIDGRQFPTDADRFTITSRQSYATLVTLEPSHTGLTRLRERGLIADSPRIMGERTPAPATPDPR